MQFAQHTNDVMVKCYEIGRKRELGHSTDVKEPIIVFVLTFCFHSGCGQLFFSSSVFLCCRRSSEDTRLVDFCLTMLSHVSWFSVLFDAICSGTLLEGLTYRGGSQLSSWKLIMRSLISSDKDAFISEQKAPSTEADRHPMRQALPLLLLLITLSLWIFCNKCKICDHTSIVSELKPQISSYKLFICIKNLFGLERLNILGILLKIAEVFVLILAKDVLSFLKMWLTAVSASIQHVQKCPRGRNKTSSSSRRQRRISPAGHLNN